MRPLLVLLTALVAAPLTGCGEDRPGTGGPAGSAYTGPLVVTRDEAVHPNAGAAGNVVECAAWGRGGVQDEAVYAEGATAESPEEALEVAASEWLVDGPTEGLRVAAREDDRVLWVLELDGEVKQAVVVRDGPATEGAGGDGWYVESWARCDNAELPRSWNERIGLLVWEDAETGEPVPTTEVVAWRGPEHCDWQSMTLLHLGRAVYVRDPVPGLGDFFAEPWRPHTELPADAVDTGYRRSGESLWLSADRQRAFVGSRDDVELWPRTVQSLGCE